LQCFELLWLVTYFYKITKLHIHYNGNDLLNYPILRKFKAIPEMIRKILLFKKEENKKNSV